MHIFSKRITFSQLKPTLKSVLYIQIMSRTAKLYRDLIDALKLIPLDKSKSGRDFNQVLRHSFARTFKDREDTVIQSSNELARWERCLRSIRTLGSNAMKSTYPRQFNVGACGASLEQCRFILSNEVMEKMK
ncbi:hypothetical protein ACOME3_003680 [Neoechinorhynchus agilis]